MLSERQKQLRAVAIAIGPATLLHFYRHPTLEGHYDGIDEIADALDELAEQGAIRRYHPADIVDWYYYDGRDIEGRIIPEEAPESI